MSLQYFQSYLSFLFLLPLTLFAGETDWPQWRGQNRDGHAAPQSLLRSWPAEGPRLVWTFSDAGRGYSGSAIAGGRLYTIGARDEKCFAICLDATNGELIWETEVSRQSTPDDYNHGWGGGPRSTPTVNGDQVFVLSDVGKLACLASADGGIVWSVDLVEQYGGGIPKWGYSESPLVDGDRVLVTPGNEQFMVGLDRHTGEQVWASKGVNAPAQYVSIMKGELGQTSFYVTASDVGLLAFDTETGQLVFRDSATGNDVAVIPTPILTEDMLYHTSDYGAGNTLLQLSSQGDRIEAKSIYHLEGKSMQNHHGGVVLHEGVIYGFTKTNGGVWMAQELISGETLWEEKIRPNNSGSICFADGMLYCYNDKDASLMLVEPNRENWTPKGLLTLPRQTGLQRDRGAIWTHPVIANQMLFIRDQDLVFAFDIGREE